MHVCQGLARVEDMIYTVLCARPIEYIKNKIYWFLFYECFSWMEICASYVILISTKTKIALYCLDAKLQMVVNYRVDAGDQTPDLWKSTKCFNTTELTLALGTFFPYILGAKFYLVETEKFFCFKVKLKRIFRWGFSSMVRVILQHPWCPGFHSQ